VRYARGYFVEKEREGGRGVFRTGCFEGEYYSDGEKHQGAGRMGSRLS